MKLLAKGLAVVLVLLAVALVASRLLAVQREVGDPAAPRGDTARVATVNGLALHYGEWGPADGPVLLLIPGALAWSQTWRDIAEPLGEDGYRVIALDLPPFGYSRRPANGIYSRKALGDLVVAFADALALDRFTLVGHSFGGGATIEAAMAAPGRVEALVLLDVAMGLDAAAGDGGWLRDVLSVGEARHTLAAATFANPLFTGMGLRSFIHDDAVVTQERIALYQAPLDTVGASEAIGDWLYTGLFAPESGAASADRARYGALDMPALVIWGREDTVTPLAQGEDIAGLLPNAELVVLDDVNHIPHVEAPAAVVDAIRSFLGWQPPTQTAPGKEDRLDLRPSITP